MLGKKYLKEVSNIIDKVLETQLDKIEATARIIVEAAMSKNSIYIFGCNHAGILTQELFYRTGGLAIINPVTAPGLTLDARPVTLTTEIERLNGYGRIIVDSLKLKENDVLIIHSVSGINNVTVDMALRAHELRVKVIVITNMAYTSKVKSRHHSGKRLFELADLVLDNCGAYGDAAVAVEGMQLRVGPTSTVIGAAIMNAVVVESAALFIEKGIIPPVFMSSNMEGGDEYNARILEEYRDSIHYI